MSSCCSVSRSAFLNFPHLGFFFNFFFIFKISVSFYYASQKSVVLTSSRAFVRPFYINVFLSLCVCVCSPVLKPLVEVLSDPDSINRMLLSQLEKREQQAEQQKKAYTYAASYEDFIKLISTSTDVNFLKQLRHDSDNVHTDTHTVDAYITSFK